MAATGEGGAKEQAIMAIVLVARQVGLLDDAQPSQKPTGAKPKKAQQVDWDVPEAIEYGTPMSDIPAAVVRAGPGGVVPVYTPQRGSRVPGFGDHLLTVVVPGDDEYEEAKLVRPLHVRRRKLTVRALPAIGELGKPMPELKHEVIGALVEGDRLDVTMKCDAGPAPAENMSGYTVVPVVAFAKGLAQNYEVTTVPGALKVRPSADAMETRIAELRHKVVTIEKVVKAMTPGRGRDAKLQQLAEMNKRFDAVKDARMGTDKTEANPDRQAEKLFEIACDLSEFEYFPVTAVSVKASVTRIEGMAQTVSCSASVEPKNASQPALKWSSDDEAVATVDADSGVVTRSGRRGGKVGITATSQCREGLIETVLIDVVPMPASVEIEDPGHVFLSDPPLTLKARVLPEGADQGVRWTMPVGKQKKKNVAFDALKGTLSVAEDSHPMAAKSGVFTVRATSLADPACSVDLDIPFGGKRTASIHITPKDKEVARGESVALSAKVTPDAALQDLEWTLDDESIASLEVDPTTPLKATVRCTGGGELKVFAKAKDGSGVVAEATIASTMPVSGFTIRCAQNKVSLFESVRIEPVFTPGDAVCRVQWGIDSGGAAAQIKGGVVTALGGGKIKVTASLPRTAFRATLELDVEVPADLRPGKAQWPLVEPLLRKYADRVCITEFPKSRRAFEEWLMDLRLGVLNEGKTVPALADVKTTLLNLRRDNLELTHQEWLEKAGFAKSTRQGSKCMIAHNTTLPFGGTDYDVHMTMFPHATPIKLGNDYPTFEGLIYRLSRELQSMHATLYLPVPSVGDIDVKVFASGSVYTTKYAGRQFLGGDDTAIKADLKTWMDGHVTNAKTELEGLFNRVHANDAAGIA